MTEKRKLPRGIWVILIICLVLVAVLLLCDGGTKKYTKTTDGAHIYDKTEVYGTIAVTHISESEATLENLEDYYFNFYIKNFFLKKHVIIFDDTEPLRGVDFIGGNLYVNVLFEDNGDGTYTNVSTDADKDNIIVYHEEKEHLVTNQN